LAQRQAKLHRNGKEGKSPEVATAMLEACRTASLQIGGPTLSRLGITSSVRGEGRTSVALAMARIQREDYGRSVLLVDLDFDNPNLAQLCGGRTWPGLAELARAHDPWFEEFMQPIADGITFIAAGAAGGFAPRIISDIQRGELLQRASAGYDVVIADLPPLLGCTFGLAVAAWFPDLLLVVRSRVTPLARIRQATRYLPAVPRVLLNCAESDLPPWLRKLSGS
jgi:Mrp family chromosome partitioning ATPase